MHVERARHLERSQTPEMPDLPPPLVFTIRHFSFFTDTARHLAWRCWGALLVKNLPAAGLEDSALAIVTGKADQLLASNKERVGLKDGIRSWCSRDAPKRRKREAATPWQNLCNGA